MTKTRVRVTSGLLWVLLSLLSFYHPSPVNAETYVVTQNNRDFYFQSAEQATMTVRTYAQQYGIDSMLWVYRPDNSVVTQNDDYFGLDSFVRFSMEPGVTYRLRAGVCCGNPNAWYGSSYVIEPSLVPTNQTTTTTELSTTTVPPTTTEPETTTTTTSTTSTTTTSTTTTTTTTVPETTTTVPVTTSIQPVPTTTTTTSTTSTVPETTTSSSTTTSTTPAVTTTVQPTTTLPPQTTLLPTTSTSEPPVTTTTIPILESMSPTEAVAVATNPEVLQTLTSEQAAEVFDALVVSELSDEEATQLIDAVQDAPETVRAQFEDKVNIFDNKFSTYVPLGSKINVAQRKVLIAATGVLFMAPTVPSTSGSASSNRRK